MNSGGGVGNSDQLQTHYRTEKDGCKTVWGCLFGNDRWKDYFKEKDKQNQLIAEQKKKILCASGCGLQVVCPKQSVTESKQYKNQQNELASQEKRSKRAMGRTVSNERSSKNRKVCRNKRPSRSKIDKYENESKKKKGCLAPLGFMCCVPEDGSVEEVKKGGSGKKDRKLCQKELSCGVSCSWPCWKCLGKQKQCPDDPKPKCPEPQKPVCPEPPRRKISIASSKENTMNNDSKQQRDLKSNDGLNSRKGSKSSTSVKEFSDYSTSERGLKDGNENSSDDISDVNSNLHCENINFLEKKVENLLKKYVDLENSLNKLETEDRSIPVNPSDMFRLERSDSRPSVLCIRYPENPSMRTCVRHELGQNCVQINQENGNLTIHGESWGKEEDSSTIQKFTDNIINALSRNIYNSNEGNDQKSLTSKQICSDKKCNKYNSTVGNVIEKQNNIAVCHCQMEWLKCIEYQVEDNTFQNYIREKVLLSILHRTNITPYYFQDQEYFYE